MPGLREAAASAVAHDDLGSRYRTNRHARTSVTANSFSVESAANCLIGTLEVSQKLKDEIDKLPLLAKMDLYAHMTVGKSLSPHDSRFSKMIELTRARNAFVYPRSKKTGFGVEGIQETVADYVAGVSIEAETYASLNIPKWPMFWPHHSAESVLVASCDFLAWYFKDILAYSAKHVSKLLSSRMIFGGHVRIAVFEGIYDEIRAIGSQFDFLYLNIPDASEPDRRKMLYQEVPS
ncbi:hypothetical protein [Paraburkholderia sp. RL17-337-BIB-A]|uniref:hypothetical protein n=1 Tax=Paraburkholderia sp. RL17-337-BIB-A TaxID=3031636 RepID=UPI0038BBEF98